MATTRLRTLQALLTLCVELIVSYPFAAAANPQITSGPIVTVTGDVVRLSCDLEQTAQGIIYKDCAINNCHAKENGAGLYDLKSGKLYIPLDKKTHRPPNEISEKLKLGTSATVTGILFQSEDATPIIYVVSVD